MTTPNIPIVNEGLRYANGLQLSPGPVNADNVTTGTLIIQNGQCRDSTDTNDIVLNAGPYTLNPALNGVNGIDIGGVLALDTLYYVYVIADSRSYQPAATLLSANDGITVVAGLVQNPMLPAGYDMFRRIGTVLTSHVAAPNTRFFWFRQQGNREVRDTWYGVPKPVFAAAAVNVNTLFNWTTTAAGLANVVPRTAGKVYCLVTLAPNAIGSYARLCTDATQLVANNPFEQEIVATAVQSTVGNLQIGTLPSAGPVLPMQSAFYNTADGSTIAVSCEGFQDLL
jgi:hypothetical protein